MFLEAGRPSLNLVNRFPSPLRTNVPLLMIIKWLRGRDHAEPMIHWASGTTWLRSEVICQNNAISWCPSPPQETMWTYLYFLLACPSWNIWKHTIIWWSYQLLHNNSKNKTRSLMFVHWKCFRRKQTSVLKDSYKLSAAPSHKFPHAALEAALSWSTWSVTWWLHLIATSTNSAVICRFFWR